MMINKNERIDVYIGKSAEFAKPVLNHIRKLVHKACPDTEEKIKWGFPHFDYKGEMMCSMAAFKQHCALNFWKASIMKKNKAMLTEDRPSMGNFGKITAIKDLPPDNVLISLIKEAMVLNEKGIKIKSSISKRSGPENEMEIPDYFKKVLNRNKKAKEVFLSFSPSHKREYLEWITEAKSEITRNKRIAIAIEWLSEGKQKNWKYINKIK